MIPGRVFIAASLDGFIARADGDIDWLLSLPDDPDGDYGYSDFIETVDGLVMGRGTFEKVVTFEKWLYTKPVVVMSGSLTTEDIPERLVGKVRISSLPPRALMEELEQEGWKGVYVDGGKVIQSFLREGLIREMIVSHIPVLIGGGIPLFGSLEADIRLEHIETKVFPSGLVRSHYRIG